MRFFALCAFLLPVAAAADEVAFERTVLPNGLVVIYHEDHRLPHVTVNLWYHVGSADEKPGHSGFAHLFEHLMFMGSKNVPYDLDKGAGLFDLIMEAQGGSNNASTSEDRTNYYEEGPSNLLETFLWLEADRMATLSRTIDQEKVDRQRRVVQNERRQSYENRPYGMAGLTEAEEMFPPEHPYHHPVIGSHEDLEKSTVDDVKGFFDTWYVPKNASMVIAGDFDAAKTKPLVEKYFGWIERAAPPAHPPVAPAQLAASKARTIEDNVRLPRTYIVYAAPPAYADGTAECDLLARILGGSKSSRLQRTLRLEKQLAQDVRVDCQPGDLAGTLDIRVTARPGHTLAEVDTAIDAELARLATSPPTQTELTGALARLETETAETLESQHDLADKLNDYETHFHDPGRFAWDRARYRAVTTASLATWVDRLLGAHPRFVLHVVPRTEAAK